MRVMIAAGAIGLFTFTAHAAEVVVPIYSITANGMSEQLGTIELRDSADGLQIRTSLSKLPAGQRGFHVHENPNCGPAPVDGKPTAGMAAGSHYDQGRTGKHLGPNGAGHIGDLPALTVDARGQARTNMTVKRLSVDAIRGRSLMIHGGGDTYNEPPAAGGGGARIACGVIPK